MAELAKLASVVVCKAKIWLAGGCRPALSYHQTKRYSVYARERDVTQKQAKNRKSILRHQRGDSSRFEARWLVGYWFGF
jgi:hypothetical protein